MNYIYWKKYNLFLVFISFLEKLLKKLLGLRMFAKKAMIYVNC